MGMTQHNSSGRLVRLGHKGLKVYTVGCRDREGHSVENHSAVAAKMISPVTREARMRYRVCTIPKRIGVV